MNAGSFDAYAPPSVGGDVRISRRAAAHRLGGILAAGWLVAKQPTQILAQEATPPPLARFAGGTFVGETSMPDTFVAIVLGEAGAARGYLCDGPARTIDAWFLGEVVDDQLHLAAADGSQVRGVLNSAGVGGGATLADGRGLVFTALPATGIAGLYTVAVLPDGRLEGVTAAGGTLVGELAAEAPAEGRYAFVTTVTTPDGESFAGTISTATTEAGEFRTIVLPDGRSRGRGKSKGGQVMDPGMDFQR